MQQQSRFVNVMVGVCLGFGLCMIMQSLVYPKKSECRLPNVKQEVESVIEIVVPEKSEQEQVVVPVVVE